MRLLDQIPGNRLTLDGVRQRASLPLCGVLGNNHGSRQAPSLCGSRFAGTYSRSRPTSFARCSYWSDSIREEAHRFLTMASGVSMFLDATSSLTTGLPHT